MPDDARCVALLRGSEVELQATPDSIAMTTATFSHEHCSMSILGAKECITEIEGNTQKDTYVLDNGTQWKLKYAVSPMWTYGKVQAKVSVDGNHVGTFILRPGVSYAPLERPLDCAKKFTFYTVREVKMRRQERLLGRAARTRRHAPWRPAASRVTTRTTESSDARSRRRLTLA